MINLSSDKNRVTSVDNDPGDYVPMETNVQKHHKNDITDAAGGAL